jgi:hypothetical protein
MAVKKKAPKPEVVDVDVEKKEMEAAGPIINKPEIPEVEEVRLGWTESMHDKEFVNKLDFAVGGIYQDDPTAIPEYVETFDGRRRRIRPDGIAFRWASWERIPERKRQGYRFVIYNDLFEDTGLFERDVNGRVVNGDAVLMYIGKEQLAKIAAAVAQRRKLMEDGAAESFHTDAHAIARQAGIHNFYTTSGDKRDGVKEERFE